MNVALVERNAECKLNSFQKLINKYPGCTVFQYGGFEEALLSSNRNRIDAVYVGEGIPELEAEAFQEYLKEQQLRFPTGLVANL